MDSERTRNANAAKTNWLSGALIVALLAVSGSSRLLASVMYSATENAAIMSAMPAVYARVSLRRALRNIRHLEPVPGPPHRFE